MPKLSHQFAFVAFAFWLLSSWAGTHGHFCFDGQEPPVSIHMSVMGEHLEHHADEVHQDADVDLAQSVLAQSTLAKLSKIDWALVLIAAFSLALLVLPAARFSCVYRAFYPRISLYWRPLLRAPPLTA